MWEHGWWLPRWLSPEVLLVYWLVGAGLAWWAAGSERPELSALIKRLTAWLALAQSAAVSLALLWALGDPLPRVSVSDVYVVAGTSSSLLFGLAFVWLLMAIRREPQILQSYPSVRKPPSIVLWLLVLSAILLGGGSLIVSAIVGYVFFRFFLVGDNWQLYILLGGFLLSAVAALQWLGFVPWRRGRFVLGTMGLLALGAAAGLLRPERAMTDQVLFERFRYGVTDGSVSEPALAELRRRPLSRFSPLASWASTIRPGELTEQVSAQEARRSGYPGCSMVISLEPKPHEGNPELQLLAVLVARGELDLPRAWQRDGRVDENTRRDLDKLLTSSERQ